MELGAYRVEGELGRGGMGCVYRAVAPDGRRVAVKVLLQPGARHALERFRREARVQGALGLDDGFVPLLDAGEARTGPFVVMPLLEGGTLRDRLERGALPVEEAVRVGVGLAQALGRAHAQGLVHRDLKPENVLFTADGRPLVSDLGLAKHFTLDAHTAQLSKTGELRGTLGYAAPEQLRDAKSVGPPSDVFALGVILYEALTGVVPFEGETALERMAATLAGTFSPVRARRREVPPAVARVVERALARTPAERWPDGAALAAALEQAQLAPALEGAARRLGVVAALVGAALLAGGVALLARPAEDVTPQGATSEGPAAPPPPTAAATPLPPAEPLPAETRTLRRALVIGAPTWKLHEDVHSAAPLPGGERALLALADGSAALLDLARGELVWTAWGADGPAYAAAVSRDGARGATGGEAPEVRLWDLASGRKVGRLAVPTAVTALAFAPDGARLAAVGEDGVCRVLEVATGAVVHELHAGPLGGGVVTWSPDGALLLTGGRDGIVRVWRAADRELVSQRQVHQGVVTALSHADGVDAVVSGGWDGGVVVLTLERAARGVTVSERRRLQGHTEHVRAVAITSDGRRVVSGAADHTLRVWDVGSGEERATFRGESYVAAVGASPDGARVWGATWRDARLRAWRVADGAALDAPLGHLAPISGVALLPGGRALTAARDATLRLWDLESGQQLQELAHPDGVFAFATSPDGAGALSGAAGGEVMVWDLERDQRTRLSRGSGWALAGAFSKLGLLAVGYSSGQVRVQQPGLEPMVLSGHRADVTAAVFTAGMGLVTGGADGVRVWDLSKTLAGHREVLRDGGPVVRALAISEGGTLLAGDDSGAVEAWSLDDDLRARPLRVLRHPRAVRGLAVTPDGARLVTACWDGAVRVWDLASGEEVDRIDLSAGHDRPTAVAVSADGREVLVGTSRGVVARYVAR